MHTQILKVRQEGTRAVRVTREFTLEVPYHISKDPRQLGEWIANKERDGHDFRHWSPVGQATIEVINTRAVGHACQAMVSMTEAERAEYDAN